MTYIKKLSAVVLIFTPMGPAAAMTGSTDRASIEAVISRRIHNFGIERPEIERVADTVQTAPSAQSAISPY